MHTCTDAHSCSPRPAVMRSPSSRQGSARSAAPGRAARWRCGPAPARRSGAPPPPPRRCTRERKSVGESAVRALALGERPSSREGGAAPPKDPHLLTNNRGARNAQTHISAWGRSSSTSCISSSTASSRSLASSFSLLFRPRRAARTKEACGGGEGKGEGESQEKNM